jgi:hypothetical protein
MFGVKIGEEGQRDRGTKAKVERHKNGYLEQMDNFYIF